MNWYFISIWILGGLTVVDVIDDLDPKMRKTMILPITVTFIIIWPLILIASISVKIVKSFS
jgi:hypothetical protein